MSSSEIDDEYDDNNPLGLTKSQLYKNHIDDQLHYIFNHMNRDEFMSWLLRDMYMKQIEYQKLSTLEFHLKFAMDNHYIDKEGLILEEIIRTKKHLDGLG